MSSKKHKRKAVKHNAHSQKNTHSVSLLSHYPRVFLAAGILLVLISVLLVTIGYVNNARVGLAMLSIFFGGGLIIFANGALPKN